MGTQKSVLVIGGTGFIGRALVQKLVDDGDDVRVLTRRVNRPPREGVTYHVGEVADRESLRRAIDGAQVVYDLSMGGGPDWGDYLRDFVRGAENVAEVSIASGVRRLVYTSTTAALYLAKAGTVDEAAGADPHPERRGCYARAKCYAETALNGLHRMKKLPVVILRPGIVVGPGNQLAHPGLGMWVSPTCLFVVGSGRTPLPLVLVDDVAEAMRLCRDAPGVDGKTFNLVGDVRLSAAEYIEACAARSRRNFRLEPKSIQRIAAFKLMVWLGKAALRRPDNASPRFYELFTDAQRTQLDCSAAKKLLGWRPEPNRDEFVRRAIDCHLAPLRAGDLRADAEAT
jgi:nucleoside-diphosphate-sugar epimerase